MIPLLAGFPGEADASSVDVFPVRLFLDAKSKTKVLKVKNTGAAAVSVQLSVVDWSQDEGGKDVYEPTGDIVIFPKMASIEKGEERIFRIGYQGAQASVKEKTYRIFVEEIPVATTSKSVLTMNLRIGIPVFVTPPQKTADVGIDNLVLQGGRLLVNVRNGGNTHIQVGKIKAVGIAASGEESFVSESQGWYVLAGMAKTFDLDIPEEECMKTEEISVKVESRDANAESQLAVEKIQCMKKESGEKEVGKK